MGLFLTSFLTKYYFLYRDPKNPCYCKQQQGHLVNRRKRICVVKHKYSNHHPPKVKNKKKIILKICSSSRLNLSSLATTNILPAAWQCSIARCRTGLFLVSFPLSNSLNELVADRGTFDSCVVPDNLPLGRLTRIFLLLGRYSEVWRPFSHKYIDLNCKKVNMLL